MFAVEIFPSQNTVSDTVNDGESHDIDQNPWESDSKIFNFVGRANMRGLFHIKIRLFAILNRPVNI